jgi:hypothetical protein
LGLAQDRGRIAWIAKTGPRVGCVLEVRRLGTGRTLIKRLRDGECRNQSGTGAGVIQLALAGGWASWAYQRACPHHPYTGCWALGSLDLSTGHIRTVDRLTLSESSTAPLLAGAGRMVAYYRLLPLGAPPLHWS